MLKISGTNIDSVINHLAKTMTFDYEKHSKDMSVIFEESFYFRTGSYQLNMIIAKQEESDLLLDIVAAAGGVSIFNINYWSEKGYIKRVKKELEIFAIQENIVIEEVGRR